MKCKENMVLLNGYQYPINLVLFMDTLFSEFNKMNDSNNIILFRVSSTLHEQHHVVLPISTTHTQIRHAHAFCMQSCKSMIFEDL